MFFAFENKELLILSRQPTHQGEDRNDDEVYLTAAKLPIMSRSLINSHQSIFISKINLS